jgi:transglutaminase-like putative cysteine protease
MSPGETTWTSKSAEAEVVRDNKSGASMLHVVWPRSEVAPSIEVFSRFSGRDRAVEVSKTVAAVPLSADQLRHYTAATELLPTDGIVKKTADRITAGVKTDIDKARQIYEWIIDNTFRDPKSRGCGVGDIAGMLKTGNLSGKCADLNALFVGLACASSLPARDLYGIRVAPSAFGYKSLGGTCRGTALSGGSLHRRHGLATGRSSGRPQGRARRATRQFSLERSEGRRCTPLLIRRVGDELVGLQ